MYSECDVTLSGILSPKLALYLEHSSLATSTTDLESANSPATACLVKLVLNYYVYYGI